MWMFRIFNFEWDDQKATSNLLKHGVSCDEAVSVFGDGQALTFSDADHSELEDRSRTYGISNKALASMLAFAQETQGLTSRSGRTPRKRVTA